MTGISRMLDFLTALKVNNDRQWFGVHKEEYNDIRRQSYSQPATAKLLICRKKTSFGVSKFSFLRGLRLILC